MSLRDKSDDQPVIREYYDLIANLMNPNNERGTSIFEKALLERFEMMGLGEPDERILEVVQKAGSMVTEEVKSLLNEQYEHRLSNQRKLMTHDE